DKPQAQTAPVPFPTEFTRRGGHSPFRTRRPSPLSPRHPLPRRTPPAPPLQPTNPRGPCLPRPHPVGSPVCNIALHLNSRTLQFAFCLSYLLPTANYLLSSHAPHPQSHRPSPQLLPRPANRRHVRRPPSRKTPPPNLHQPPRHLPRNPAQFCTLHFAF